MPAKGVGQGAAERPKKQLKRLYQNTENQENVDKYSDDHGNDDDVHMSQVQTQQPFLGAPADMADAMLVPQLYVRSPATGLLDAMPAANLALLPGERAFHIAGAAAHDT